ncbi:MAG: class I SAM-dependent methyltransferase [Rubripirellula sp.]
MSEDRYQLIDFGNGRKLESLAGHLVDRPSPAAVGKRPHHPGRWQDADAVYDPERKSWAHRTPWPERLSINCGSFSMPVRPTPYGHIGLFPEQSGNWQWLGSNRVASPPRQSLNLFGYTGASTMALVAAGFHVAHVDAAKPNVDAVRIAAAHNGWQEPPIRYLVDDAAKFTAREVRRGRRYHTIVLDPPAYGHSPKGKAWRLERDLWPLLQECMKMLEPSSFRLLVTGHSQEVDRAEVEDFLRHSAFLRRAEAASRLLLESGRSQLEDSVGRSLDAGFYVRVESNVDS